MGRGIYIKGTGRKVASLVMLIAFFISMAFPTYLIRGHWLLTSGRH